MKCKITAEKNTGKKYGITNSKHGAILNKSYFGLSKVLYIRSPDLPLRHFLMDGFINGLQTLPSSAMCTIHCSFNNVGGLDKSVTSLGQLKNLETVQTEGNNHEKL